MKNTLKVTILLFVFLFINKGWTQYAKDTVKRESLWQLIKYDGTTAFGGLKHSLSRPAHWNKDDFLTLGGIALGSFILYSFDGESSAYFRKQKDNVPTIIRDFGRYYGAPQNNYMLTAGIYGVGLLTRNEKLRHTGVLLITSATASGLITSLSKNVFGRARPSTGEGRSTFRPFSPEGKYHSLPSGHTVLSFTTSHAIARQFDSWWVKGPIYAVGLISPVSRLWEGAHWLTDVTLGVVLSIVIVDSVDNYLKNNNKYKIQKKKSISWRLNMGTNRIGVIGTF